MSTQDVMENWYEKLRDLLKTYTSAVVQQADPALLIELDLRLGLLISFVAALEEQTGQAYPKYRTLIDKIDVKVVKKETTTEAANKRVQNLIQATHKVSEMMISENELLDDMRKELAESAKQAKVDVDRIQDGVNDGMYGSPPPPDVQKTLDDLDSAWLEVEKAVERNDFGSGDEAIEKVAEAVKAVDAARLQAIATVKQKSPTNFKFLDQWEKLARDDVLPNPFPAAIHQQARLNLQMIAAYRIQAEKAALNLDPDSLTQDYKALESAQKTLFNAQRDNKVDRRNFDTRWQALLKTHANLTQKLQDANIQDPGLTNAYQTADQEQRDTQNTSLFVAANQACDQYDQATVNSYKLLVLDAPAGKGSKRREECLEYLTEDPNFLRQLAKAPAGDEFLDRLVTDLGKKVPNGDPIPPDKKFIIEAMKARYDLEEVSGKDVHDKSLPQLYKMLGMVPKTHTKLNDSLKKIERKPESDDTSSYGSNTKQFTLTVKRTDETVELGDYDDDVPKDIRPKVKPGEKINYFNHTTLHEIGHSVDDRLKLMASKANIGQYGGWNTHTIEDIAELAASQKGLYEDWYSYPQGDIKNFLVEVLKGGDPADKVNALNPDPNDIPSIIGHAAVKWCLAIRMQTKSSGLWDTGAKSKDLAIGGRVYQQSYEKEWYSYEAGARSSGVSQYQFRAPAEWFAEIYAMYYLKKLPEKHPAYSLIQMVDNL